MPGLERGGSGVYQCRRIRTKRRANISPGFTISSAIKQQQPFQGSDGSEKTDCSSTVIMDQSCHGLPCSPMPRLNRISLLLNQLAANVNFASGIVRQGQSRDISGQWTIPCKS